MPVSSEDLCSFARKVAQSTASDETALRASASRAYYAAFHALLPMVIRLPKSSKFRPGSSNITHEDFATRLSELARAASCDADSVALKQRAGRLARLVDACRTSRVKADYKLTTEFGVAEAKQQVERAGMVLRAILDINGTSSELESFRGDGAAEA